MVNVKAVNTFRGHRSRDVSQIEKSQHRKSSKASKKERVEREVLQPLREQV